MTPELKKLFQDCEDAFGKWLAQSDKNYLQRGKIFIHLTQLYSGGKVTYYAYPEWTGAGTYKGTFGSDVFDNPEEALEDCLINIKRGI